MSVGFILTNPTGRLLWLNRAAEALLGTSREKCIGEPITRFLRDPQLAQFWRQTSGDNATQMGEICVRWPRNYELKINSTRSVSAGGTPIGRALLFCDVTQERMASLQLSQTLAHRLLELTPNLQPPVCPSNALTSQELRILRMLGTGSSNEQIAAKLVVATSTIRSHLKSVYRKLNLHSRTEAVSYAARHLS